MNQGGALQRQPTSLMQNQPQQQIRLAPTTFAGKVKEFFFPQTAQEKVIRHTQFRDVAFFVGFTGSMIVFEKQLTNWLVKESAS